MADQTIEEPMKNFATYFLENEMSLTAAHHVMRNRFRIETYRKLEHVKKDYHAKIHELHPDKGGDPNEFMLLQQAWEKVKSNPNHDKFYK